MNIPQTQDQVEIEIAMIADGWRQCAKGQRTTQFCGWINQVQADMAELVAAAQAVVDRWDSPLWKDQPATGEYIARLRVAIAKASA